MKITVSIVNHGHCSMIEDLVYQLSRKCISIERVVLTQNIPSMLNFDQSNIPFEIIYIENDKPIGFGENHNNAFRHCKTDLFCVMNPDIEIIDDPFPSLENTLALPNVGIAAPQVIDSNGNLEDSARIFPTPSMLLKKMLLNSRGTFEGEFKNGVQYPDWVAGMFLLFRSEFYSEIGGFDEAYFLYYEDIDISLRTWKLGKKVAFNQEAVVVHNAQRSSHKNFRLFTIHIRSIVLFFTKHLFRFPN
jgi:N-acetylglucosaminyl-diphospho-decaprenol L-rhamnosyltransferase